MNHDIEAYLDGSLDPQARAEFEAQLARDAALRDAVATARHLRDDLSWLSVSEARCPASRLFGKKKAPVGIGIAGFGCCWESCFC
jgi:anti-sigma factor RsiW